MATVNDFDMYGNSIKRAIYVTILAPYMDVGAEMKGEKAVKLEVPHGISQRGEQKWHLFVCSDLYLQ